ncbi:MAG TPA: TIGR02453 family protein [Acidimicrobiia bacterium]|nr:TIGR02453 family protein [Acidimicrobiia bacterium]
MTVRYFTPALFGFLRELAVNNEKTWWEQNKDRYVTVIREPALEFISDFAPRLAAISTHFVADSRTSGGSLMRPYRDTRFSPDKTPYKTNVGIQFRHETGKDVHAPGFYIHLEPAGSFAGVGMWRPDAATAGLVRQRIAGHPEEWSDATGSRTFTEVWALEHDEDEMLKRVPRELGGDPRHGDDLRLRSFVAVARLTQKEITSDGFDTRLATMFGRSAGFARFLCDAIGARF